MMKLKYEVKYISNSCTQTDELLNHPHQAVAESLYDLLKNHNEIQHPVIGLEGSWGAGKSQVISILQKMISNQESSSKYKFLTYDIWSAQEDLTRRSFLDSVLSEVKSDSEHFNNIKQLEEDYKTLNATVTRRSTKTFPLVRLFFAIILLIPVLLFVINSIELAFGYNPSAPLSYDKLKGLISIGLTLLALGFFIKAYKDETEAVNNDNELKDKPCWEKFQIVIGRLFYIYNAKDVEKKDLETILKDEPSISRFQNFFNHVCDELKDGCVLVIVFENMDRLSGSQKLMSTWSLLHTFFTEKNYDGKIWALVPYSQQQLSALMNGQEINDLKTSEFINKTFFTTFRIPEPIMGSWKDFLNRKLDIAFTPHLDDEDKNFVTLIFSRLMAKRTIRPRDIIAYVNRLVALYSQHHFEDIPMRFIALYAQYESEITKTPIECILNHKGFEKMVPLVGKEHVSQWLSSIYYNLPSSSSLEVIYDREIEAFLKSDYEMFEDKDEAQEAYQRLSSNELFHNHIEEFFNKDLDLSELKLENVFYLLNKDSITQATKKRIYIIVSEQVNKLKDQLLQYEAWMENAFLTYSIEVTNIIVNALLQNAKESFETHYSTVVPLLQLQQKRSSIKLNFNPYKTESPKEMLEYYDYLLDEGATALFKKAKVLIDSAKLLEYMNEGVVGNLLFGSNTDKVYGLLQLMKESNQDLSPITEAINSANCYLANLEHKQVERIYRVFCIVNEDNTTVPSYTLIDARSTRFIDIPEYLVCTLIKLKDNGFDINNINRCLTEPLTADKQIVAKLLPRYFNIDELLNVALSYDNQLLKDICKLYLEKDRGNFDTPDEILSATNRIVKEILNGVEDILLNYLDNRVGDVKKKAKNKFLKIDSFWWENINKEAINKHPIFKAICDQWLFEFNNFNDSTWKEEFANIDGNVSLILQKLDEVEIINKDFWAIIPEKQVSQAYIDAIVNKAPLDFVLFNKWKRNVSKASIAKIANDTFYAITNPREIEKTKFIHFVEILWENSELIKNRERADEIFDDYISDYLSSDEYDHIGTFISDHQNQIDALFDNISEDRRKNCVEKIKNIQSKVENASKVFSNLQTLIDKYGAKKR